MSDFEQAIDYVLGNEGGFVNNINDSGGATNRGISLRFIRSLSSERLRRYGIFEPITIETIKYLTEPQTRFVYRGEFWDQSNFDQIDDQRLSNYMLDTGVHIGIAQSIKLLQRAVWAAVGIKDFIKDDGVLGLTTAGAVNSLDAALLLPIVVANRASFCRLLAEKRPKDREFLNGWLNRCYKI